MSDKINDGGPAFPTHPAIYSSADHHLAQGMSLRDWFATHAPAMPDWWRNSERQWTHPPGWQDGMKHCDWERLSNEFAVDLMVSWRWHYADAMIAARSKGGAQ